MKEKKSTVKIYHDKNVSTYGFQFRPDDHRPAQEFVFEVLTLFDIFLKPPYPTTMQSVNRGHESVPNLVVDDTRPHYLNNLAHVVLNVGHRGDCLEHPGQTRPGSGVDIFVSSSSRESPSEKQGVLDKVGVV